MILTDQQTRLFEYVKQFHADQVRKYTGEPYYNHLYSVAEIVSEYVPNTIEIALCHDLLEDTPCTSEALSNALKYIGYSAAYTTSIIQGVLKLTDEYTHEKYPDMNRAERKYQEAYRLSFVGDLIQSIKYADIIDNTKSIVQHDLNFSKVYLKECVTLLHRMRNGNIDLFIKCAHSIQEGLNKIQSEVRTKDTELEQTFIARSRKG